MAETLVSPGVLARENDQSFITQQPVSVGASLIGPTVKGPVEVPTLVTSYSDFKNKFGAVLTSGSNEYTYFTSIAAYNYFVNGGESLLVSRVASGSYTPASTSTIYNSVESGVLSTEADALLGSLGSFNATGSTGGTVTGVLSSNVNVTASFTLANSESISSITVTGQGGTFEIGDTITFTSASLGATQAGGIDLTVTLVADDIVNQQAFVLTTLSDGEIMNSSGTEASSGALTNGTADNIRWEVQNSNTDKGTFTLLIRQGNDITNDKSVLETFTNLSLDPKASNFISRVIGDQSKSYNVADNQVAVSGQYVNASRYVRVSAVNALTPDYFDNNGVAKPALTGSLPADGSGSFSGAVGALKAGANFYDNINSSDTQGLVGANYDNMISLMSNQDDYLYNVLLVPGLYDADYTSQITSLITNTQNRGDALLVVDPRAYGATVANAVSTAGTRNSSYAASYWPWVQVVDPDTGAMVWVPASTVMGGVFAYNDSVSEPWFAPAGINRGGLSQVVRAEKKLTQANRDTLYDGKVNPIATFPGTGVVVYGQKTLQTRASALDRVNVRRLLIQLKSYISQVANNLVFEQNTIATRNQFLNQVNPYLESVQQRQGLYAFKVVMDDTNNSADVIDRNELVGQIYIQPTKTAEFIYLDFNVLPTGATFPA